MNIGIVGLGLIGGSLAKSIKNRTGHTVYATDTDDETMLLARMCGAVDAELTEERLGRCDLLFVAIRPQAAVDWVRRNGEKISKNTVLIDLCGVKRAVCTPMGETAKHYGFSYIGGHPMAGKERGGFQNSSDDLFDGAPMILTPDARSTPDLLETLDKFFTDVGFARVMYTSPEEHDQIIAYTSQLAHIVSNAYIKSPEAQRQRGFSAGSFRDMTRVAYLDEEMWTELFMHNADCLTEEIERLIGHLTEYRDALSARDAGRLCKLLQDGRESKILAGGN